MGLWGASDSRGGGGGQESLGGAESTLKGIREKQFTKIDAYASMAERLVRYLETEGALQTKIKRNTSTQQSVICQLVCSIRQGGK